MERNEGEQLWWVFVWVITFCWCVLMCASCANSQATRNVATSDNLTIIDLSGEPVDVLEVAEFVRVFFASWEKAGLGTQAQTLYSMRQRPVVAYFPPTSYLACGDIPGELDHGLCAGFSNTGWISMFVAKPLGEPIGCGSLAHEMAHIMLSRQYNHADSTHKKVPAIWGEGGLLAQIQIRLGCTFTQNLREWR